MARISVPADDREYILHDILVKNLISCPKKNDTKCLMVNFIDGDGDDELVLNEIDCQELAYIYLQWKNGKGFKRCKSCGRLMRSKGSKDICAYCEQSPRDTTHIWCIDCGDIIEISPFATEVCRCEPCNSIYQRQKNFEKTSYNRILAEAEKNYKKKNCNKKSSSLISENSVYTENKLITTVFDDVLVEQQSETQDNVSEEQFSTTSFLRIFSKTSFQFSGISIRKLSVSISPFS